MRVRSLTCPGCGGRTRIAHGEQEALCVQCGQPVRLSQAVLQEQAEARRYPTRTPLRLGMKAHFEARDYELTGRQVFVQVDEAEVSTWEEWVLIAPDGDVLYLEYDEGKWKCSRPFVPEEPVPLERLERLNPGDALRLDGGALVTDRGVCHVAYAEGEFPFVVVPNRPVTYLDASAGATFYAVEWTEDALEFYRGRFLDPRQVYVMFDMRDRLAALERREQAKRARRRFGGVCVGLALVMLVLWARSLGSGAHVPRGTGTTMLAQVGPDGRRFGPIALTAVNRVHRLELQGSMRQSSHWVQAILEDDQQRELFAAQRDMWDESGYDSDGPWHESDLHASSDFVLRRAGNYYVRLYTETDAGRFAAADASATFRLKERVLYPLYLGLYGFGMLALGVLFLLAGSSSAGSEGE